MSTVTVSPAAMRIVRLLVGNPPLSVAELIRSAGVTRTAITEQLNELVAGGFVDRTAQRLPGRGRPRYVYSATTGALLLLFASNQQILVPAIWKSIADVGGRELMRKVLKRVTARVAEHYRPRITGRSPHERLRQMTELLVEEGHLVEVREEDQGRLVVQKRSCPFISMFEEMRTVCDVDIELMSAIAGAPVRRTACRHDGAPCCTFELARPDGK
ncbi:MAG: helix-turn-helix transcriptional regulator [Thermoguttaceae bacterium]